MQDAIGLIETRGLVGLVEATDAMAKAANVQIAKRVGIGGGLVTTVVRGDVGSRRQGRLAGRRAGGQPHHPPACRRRNCRVPIVTRSLHATREKKVGFRVQGPGFRMMLQAALVNANEFASHGWIYGAACSKVLNPETRTLNPNLLGHRSQGSMTR
jgi:ethanolamine utilization protein EutM